MAVFDIYTKPGCTYCDQAKNLLRIHKHEYREKLFQTADEIEVFKSAGYMTFPQIFHRGIKIGGFDQLKVYLRNMTDQDDF